MYRIIKKTQDTIIKIVNQCNVCVNCGRTEQDLVGTSINTFKNINIFSVEELCIDCEIMTYPERFHGCSFCRRPIREKFSCTICSNGFLGWVNDFVHSLDSFNIMIKRSALDLIERTIYDMPELEKTQFILRIDDSYYKWPGFYAGITNRFSRDTLNSKQNKKQNKKSMTTSVCVDYIIDHEESMDIIINNQYENKIVHVEDQNTNNYVPIWIIPRILKQGKFDISDLTLDFNIFQKWLLEILENNNIHLYDDVQIDGETIEFEQIIKVNTYDTRVIKPLNM